MSGGPTILHADLDAFYASVEQLLDPALRGRPVAVGGSARGGVVLAASYEAKAHGVQGGMPGWRAARLCPRLVFVRGHFDRYQGLADQVMAILGDATPTVQRVSIDEAFLDVSGTTHLLGPPATIATRIRQRVRAEVGLPISVGAARTKHLAKIASQVAKPDGLVVVEPAREREFLDPLPVGLMWGVGPVTREQLAGRGIHTIGELAQTETRTLERLLGYAAGTTLHALAHNEDPRRVTSGVRARSVGAQSALGRRRATPELVRATLGHLAERVAGRLRAKGRAGRTVTVRVRYAGMRSVTRYHTLAAPVDATLTLTEVAERLVWQAIDDECGIPAGRRGEGEERRAAAEISLLAISVSNLVAQHAVQLELPLPPPDPWRPGSVTGSARWAVDRSMDEVRARFGRDAVGYLPAALERTGGVPDDFRELAEHD
ncbi:DNA polymerase IV [Georgenia sp. 10Sc9-8]|uniref:DNA polymerase IV n=1 Tax=Georgenia halotolerans TaxID=3028317 RepID=A0ABT5TY95_9MICO|nr:DNA polymerase IV [Georgenia halotolerans]